MQIRAVCHNCPKITLVSGIFLLSKIKKCLSKKTLERCRVNLENRDFSSDELNTSLKNHELKVEIKGNWPFYRQYILEDSNLKEFFCARYFKIFFRDVEPHFGTLL